MLPTPPVAPPPRLFLVDGYALIYRAFFALISRPLRTSRGENTSAAWGIVNFLNRLITQHRPEYLGWVHDSGMSFRHEQYPAYKATREKLTEELQDDFDRGMERICQLLDAYRIPIITLRGYEADDVIGTLATVTPSAVDVVTGDRDLFQLADDERDVRVIYTARGMSNLELVTSEVVQAKYGVRADQYADFAAMRGDTSDGLPGVAGIGEKTAARLLAEFGDLAGIMTAVDDPAAKLTPSQRRRLDEARPYVAVAPKVVRVAGDVPLPEVDTALPRAPRDPAALEQLAGRWGLGGSLQRLVTTLTEQRA
jgi:5'-3' exonuclease